MTKAIKKGLSVAGKNDFTLDDTVRWIEQGRHKPAFKRIIEGRRPDSKDMKGDS